MTTILVVAAVVLIAVAVATAPRLRHDVATVTTCGTALPVSLPAWRRARGLARVVAFVQVGRITIHGTDHLRQPGPAMFVPNHPHFADAAVVPIILGAPARYLVARGVLAFGGGLGALVLGRTGVVCVDLRPGRGVPALRTAVRLLAAGERLLIFPEGWAHMDGAPGPYKRGAAYIAREASARLGRPVTIVPMFLRYGRYPGPRIKRFNPRLQYLIVLLGFWYFRRGVTVVVGEPIAADTLPTDIGDATRVLQHRIHSLDPEIAK